jgi:hypothetical protein
VRRRCAIISLLLAWCCANGAVWDVAQLFAWSRMFTGYAGTLPVAEALRETFDPAKPCPICQAIAQAKHTEEKPVLPQTTESAVKLVLALDMPGRVFIVRSSTNWPRMHSSLGESRVEPVPVPPPRA